MRTAFLATLAILLGSNLINLGRNAESRPYLIAPKDSIYAAARDSNSKKVNTTFAVYHYLRARLPEGTTLTIPPLLKEHLGMLRQISRLQVKVAPDPLELETHRYIRARRGWDRSVPLLVHGDYRRLFFVIEPGQRDYVIAPEVGTARMLLIPARRYQEVLELTPPPLVWPDPAPSHR